MLSSRPWELSSMDRTKSVKEVKLSSMTLMNNKKSTSKGEKKDCRMSLWMKKMKVIRKLLRRGSVSGSLSRLLRRMRSAMTSCRSSFKSTVCKNREGR